MSAAGGAAMTAMVLEEWGGGFVAQRRPVPDPGPGEARVRVVATGAGLTLEHARRGRLGGDVPRVLGHEYAGYVDALGAGAEGPAVGTAVTGSFYLTCGTCAWCAGGRETLCDNMGGYVGVARDGAFAEQLVVPARTLVPIPPGIDIATAGVIADAVATPYHVATRRIPDLRAGARVAVVGAGGGLGVHTLQVLRAFGAITLAVERDRAKAAELQRRGLADAVLVPETGEWAAQAAEAAGGPLLAVVDIVGGAATLGESVRAVGRGGTVVVLGYEPGAELAVDPGRLLLEEISVTGTRYATRAEIAAALQLVADGRVEPVIGARFPLARLDDAFAAIRDNAVFGRVIVDVAPATATG
jgi:propanol-preferring alcohol dehydrogenase